MFHKCKCFYIPPHVSGQILRRASGVVNISEDFARGLEDSVASLRKSEVDAKSFRQLRASDPETRAFSKQLEAIADDDEDDLPEPKSGSRIVYDCENKDEKRVKLVGKESKPPKRDSAAENAFHSAAIVRDFLENVLGWTSIDGKNMNIILNVHFGKDYANAFWDGDEMTFGDGDGEIFGSFAKSLDVVAHELAHGVTQFTANLDYYSQSGALNEHFSDVFGTAITQYNANQSPDSADWLIGNEIMGSALSGETLRSMKAPGTAYSNSLMGDDPQPAHMRDYYDGFADNQGVHVNSGIPNRVFYLVATDQLGTERAARLWFDTLLKLWPTADFADFADVLISTAQESTGKRRVPEGTTQTVRLALREVGL